MSRHFYPYQRSSSCACLSWGRNYHQRLTMATRDLSYLRYASCRFYGSNYCDCSSFLFDSWLHFTSIIFFWEQWLSIFLLRGVLLPPWSSFARCTCAKTWQSFFSCLSIAGSSSHWRIGNFTPSRSFYAGALSLAASWQTFKWVSLI